MSADLDPQPSDARGAAGAADAVDEARAIVASAGVHEIPAAVMRPRLRADGSRWDRFAGHWEELGPDRYAADSGTHRMRRYGQFLLDRDGNRHLRRHGEFRQPTHTNRLFPTAGRTFAPLTDAFVADPVLDALLPLLAEIASGIEDASQWTVHVHPFRVVGSADSRGDATPEGPHQDGVTLVSSLLVARRNASGGQSSVFDADGQEILATTLSEPGTLLVSDDRRTYHGVSSIGPVDVRAPARRDVLVVTLTAC